MTTENVAIIIRNLEAVPFAERTERWSALYQEAMELIEGGNTNEQSRAQIK